MSDGHPGWGTIADGRANEAPRSAVGAEAPARDDQGRFLTGNNGGGRKKGSRNKLTDLFLAAVFEDFDEHGVPALQSLREKDPVNYLRLVSSLIPRELVLQREREADFSHLTIGEIEDMLATARHNRSVQLMLQATR